MSCWTNAKAALMAVAFTGCSSTTVEDIAAMRPSADVAVEIVVSASGEALVELQSRFGDSDPPWRLSVDGELDIYYLALTEDELRAVDRRVDFDNLSTGSARLASGSCPDGLFTPDSVEVTLDSETPVFRLEGSRLNSIPSPGDFPFAGSIAVRLPLIPIECALDGQPRLEAFSGERIPFPGEERLRDGAILGPNLFLGASGRRFVTVARGQAPVVHPVNSIDGIDDPAFIIRDVTAAREPGRFLLSGSVPDQGFFAYGTATSSSVSIGPLLPLRAAVIRLFQANNGDVWGVGGNYVMRAQPGQPIEEREFAAGLPFRSIAEAPFGEMVLGGSSGTAAIGDPFGNLDVVILSEEGLQADSSLIKVLPVPPDYAYILSAQRGAFRVDVSRNFEAYPIYGTDEVLRCGGLRDECGRSAISESAPRPILTNNGDLLIPTDDCTRPVLHQFETGCTSIVERSGMDYRLDVDRGVHASFSGHGVVLVITDDDVLEYLQ